MNMSYMVPNFPWSYLNPHINVPLSQDSKNPHKPHMWQTGICITTTIGVVVSGKSGCICAFHISSTNDLQRLKHLLHVLYLNKFCPQGQHGKKYILAGDQVTEGYCWWDLTDYIQKRGYEDL